MSYPDPAAAEAAFYAAFRALNLEQPVGILVQRVAARSFADRLGLLGGTIPMKIGSETFTIGGDIIIEVQGINTSEKNAIERIRNRVQALEVGDKLRSRYCARAGSSNSQPMS